MVRKFTATEAAAKLAEIQNMPVCEECDVVREANMHARKNYGRENAGLFDANLKSILTTHVDLGCKPCPVDGLMKSFRKKRIAAMAAML